MLKQLSKTGQFLTTIARVILLSKWTGILKNKHLPAGNTCIIVGNGPSFNETLTEKQEILGRNTLMCVNLFANTPSYTELKPEFYIISAPILFYPEDKMSRLYIDMRNKLFEAFVSETTWKLHIMVPFVAKKSTAFNQVLKANPNIIPLYFNNTPAEGFFSHLFFGLGLGMPRPHNVLIPSIMNLIKLGYKEISLIGADHSWLAEISVNEKNEALVHQKHFYDENESKPLKMEDYVVRPRKLHEVLHKFYLSFKGYWDIKAYADKKGVTIYNSSKVSMIDAFERRPLQ